MAKGEKAAKPVALVDLDGTLAGFHIALAEAMAPFAGLLDHNATAREYAEDLIKRQPGFWRNLPPLPLGMEILRFLRALDYRIHILTRGPKRKPPAWTEKVEWVHAHLGAETSIHIAHDKALVYGRVLVDDWPAYIKPWLKHRPRGIVIMPAQPWNEDFTHPQVLRYGEDTSQLVLLDWLGRAKQGAPLPYAQPPTSCPGYAGDPPGTENTGGTDFPS